LWCCSRLQLLGAQTSAPAAGAPMVRRALGELLADASTRNALPSSLIAFKSRVETEISTLLRREEGTEVVTAIEQVASSLRWTRSDSTTSMSSDIGRSSRVPTSRRSRGFQTGWLNPTLYGNRLRIRTRNSSTSQTSVRKDGADTMPAIHPLAADRDRYYTFTVATRSSRSGSLIARSRSRTCRVIPAS
jgi:hypothetical protein